MLALYVLKHSHLLYGNLVEFMETFALRHAFVNEDSVEILHITQTNQLIDSCIVADIAFILRMSIAPFFCRQKLSFQQGYNLYPTWNLIPCYAHAFFWIVQELGRIFVFLRHGDIAGTKIT